MHMGLHFYSHLGPIGVKGRRHAEHGADEIGRSQMMKI